MPLSNYTADNFLNYMAGATPIPTLPSVYMALFTGVGTDVGSGFTEVTGGSYARVQVAGALTLNGAFTTSSGTLTLASTAPAWLTALGPNGYGVNVYDITVGAQIGTVSSVSGTTVTLQSAAAHAGSGASDSIAFSAFSPGSGTAPSSAVNGAAVYYVTASGAGWGTIIAFGFYDATTSGNLLGWDFLGSSAWSPWTSTSVGSGNGAVFTQHVHGYSNGTPVVVTAEYGGTLPTATQESLTSYVVNYAANVTTDTYTLSTSSSAPTSANAVWTSSTGDGMARSVSQQSVPSGVLTYFSGGTLTMTVA